MSPDEHRGIHVVPDGESWSVEIEGDAFPASSFLSEQDAVAAARDLARREGTDLDVHGADGEVKLRDSYDIAGE